MPARPPARLALLLALAAAVAAGPPGTDDPFKDAVTSTFNHVRAHAASAPPESLDQDDLKALIGLLSDRDVRVRQLAAGGLGLRAGEAGERGARALVAAAVDPYSGLDYHAPRALAMFGTSAYGPMRDTLAGKDVLSASRIWRLFRSQDKGKDLCLVFMCRAVTEEKDPAVRAMAALVMRHIGLADRDSVAALWTVATGDAPASVRAASIRAFGRLGAMMSSTDETGATRKYQKVVDALPALRELQSDEDPAVKAAAIEAMDLVEGRRSPR
ncbi:MAG: hypothetical protein AAB074_15140 [Planctomycetota bacterium]